MANMIEVLKQALETFEQLDGIDTETECITIDVGDEIASLRQAIKELESQEPVGRFAKFTDGIWRPVTDYSAGVPLYTHSDYERGFIDGMQKQMQSSVDKAVNAMSQRTWVGLTEEDRAEILSRKWWDFEDEFDVDGFLRLAEAKLKEKNT